MQKCDKTLVLGSGIAPRIPAGDHVDKNDAKGPDVAMASGIFAYTDFLPDTLCEVVNVGGRRVK